MIPETKKEAVARALQETFKVSDVEGIEQMSAGLTSALVFRIVVRGRSYLMKMMVGNEIALAPGQGDPTHQLACMRKGAEAGVAPRVWYTSVPDRLWITDFVTAKPFSREDALMRVPETLRRLHAMEPFPKLFDHDAARSMFIQKFREAKVLPEGATDKLLQQYARLTSVYGQCEADMVSCHNDLKAENILFDGEQAWLVDWEAAFLNDRYSDLAIVANFVVTNEAEEERYLAQYFGEPAGEYRRARFYLMRQKLHVSCVLLLLRLGAAGKTIDPDTEAPDFREFHDGLWTGKLSLASKDAMLQYGLVHLRRFLENVRNARFEEAMKIVGERD